ncbi:MAG: cyclic nucleotide-binding domain-containing protein [Oligoflexales bacterium]|nr:cyclic nucleotide-binding domain-containing protein [Oligoflexales bacterium]
MKESQQNIKKNMEDLAPGVQKLRSVNLFDYLTDEELTKFYSLGTVRQFQEKSHIIVEGEPSRGLYVVIQGLVSIYKRDLSTDHMIRLAFLEEGHSFGEISLFDDAPRSATALAENSCSLFHLEQEIFQKNLDETGDHLKSRFYQKCAEEMAKRFRQQNSDYVISQNLLWKHALKNEKATKAT